MLLKEYAKAETKTVININQNSHFSEQIHNLFQLHKWEKRMQYLLHREHFPHPYRENLISYTSPSIYEKSYFCIFRT